MCRMKTVSDALETLALDQYERRFSSELPHSERS